MPQAQRSGILTGVCSNTAGCHIQHCLAPMPRRICHACAQASAPLPAGTACMTLVDGVLAQGASADNTLLAHNTNACQ